MPLPVGVVRRNPLRVASLLVLLAGLVWLAVPVHCQNSDNELDNSVQWNVEPIRHLFFVAFEDGQCESIALRRGVVALIGALGLVVSLRRR